MSDVRELNILGRNYSIRVPAAERETLTQATQLLHAQIQESQHRFPRASFEELLVITALNLCVPMIQQDQRLDIAEGRLSDILLRIRKQLDVAAYSLNEC